MIVFIQFIKNKFNNLTLSIVLVFFVNTLLAQSIFPYDELTLTDGAYDNEINIKTTSGTSPFNNLLLGSNVDFNTSVARTQLSWAPLYASNGSLINFNNINQGFNSLQGQQFIANNDPVVIRFPQGVFANTYHWERVLNSNNTEIAAADSRHIIDPFIENGKTISKHDSPTGVRIGYPSLRKIFDTAIDKGKPLDLLTVLSVTGNDADSNGRRWQSMINDGLNVRDMELGNEFFWRSQRSGTINTEQQWVARAREIVSNIKNRAIQLNREVRFAIPISYRTSHQNYNNLISVDETFFDAIVVHRYISAQRDEGNKPENLTEKSLRDVLSASSLMDESLMYCKAQVSDNKDAIWLTEWGVSASEKGAIAASFLGAIDVYSHIITNNKRLEVERINWFSTVGANAQYTVNGTRNDVQIGTTGYGDVYKMLRDNLRDASLFNEVITTSPSLKVSGVEQQAKPLHILAVSTVDGNPRFIITNKTNKTARVYVNKNGVRESMFNYVSNGIKWESLITSTTQFFNDAQNEVDAILVPPYSVTKVDVSSQNFSLSVNDANTIKNRSIKVSPNPALTNVTIALNGLTKATVIIRDVLGKTIYTTETTSSLQLNTKNLFKAGLYFVKVTDENNTIYKSKLIVK